MAAGVVALVIAAVTGAFSPVAGGRSAPDRLLWGAPAGSRVAGVSVGGMTAQEVGSLLEWLRPALAVPSRDATIQRPEGRIIPEREGLELDVEATRAAVMSAREGEEILPALKPVSPKVRAADIIRLKRVKGSYFTWVGGSPGRRENIRLAAHHLDNALIPPGETFSFLEALGPTSYERGFVDAPVIVGEEFVQGPGGGVCQVATTVYNAALESGLPIVERHRHSKPVSYVPEGRDAVVAEWFFDLKIANPFEHPVLLRVGVDGGMLVARFVGP